MLFLYTYVKSKHKYFRTKKIGEIVLSGLRLLYIILYFKKKNYRYYNMPSIIILCLPVMCSGFVWGEGSMIVSSSLAFKVIETLSYDSKKVCILYRYRLWGIDHYIYLIPIYIYIYSHIDIYKTRHRMCVSVCVYSGNSIDLNESFKPITAGE